MHLPEAAAAAEAAAVDACIYAQLHDFKKHTTWREIGRSVVAAAPRLHHTLLACLYHSRNVFLAIYHHACLPGASPLAMILFGVHVWPVSPALAQLDEVAPAASALSLCFSQQKR